MQEIFIKAVTAPDDSRDIMHYEACFGNEEPKMFMSKSEALAYLQDKVKERKKDLKKQRVNHLGSCRDYDEHLYRAHEIDNALENCKMIEDNLHYMEIHEEMTCFFFKTLSD